MQKDDDRKIDKAKPAAEKSGTGYRPIDWLLSLGACAVIIAVAAGLLHLIFANQPEATREGATKKTPMLVTVETVSVGDYRPEVIVTGTVMPARQIMLSPRVGGEVIERAPAFIPGGIVKAGETLVKLDPVDYEIAIVQQRSALSQRESALSQARAAVKQAAAAEQRNRAAVQKARAAISQAEADLAIEGGRQTVAKEDFAFLDREVSAESKALVLRQPQRLSAEAELASVKAAVTVAEAEVAVSTAQIEAAKADVEAAVADVEAAKAALRRAEFDRARTTIRVPFDALVISRDVNVGSQISASGKLGTLVAIDAYWIEATVPLALLSRLEFPDTVTAGDGVTVRIRNRTGWPEGVYREGKLLKAIGTLDRQTRLARVLIEAPEPLSAVGEAPALVLDSFVVAHIPTKALSGVIRVNRDHLRENDVMWVMVDGKLDIRPVEVLFQDAAFAYIQAGEEPGKGLHSGDQIVISQLSSVRQGAALRLNGDDPEPKAQE